MRINCTYNKTTTIFGNMTNCSRSVQTDVCYEMWWSHLCRMLSMNVFGWADFRCEVSGKELHISTANWNSNLPLTIRPTKSETLQLVWKQSLGRKEPTNSSIRSSLHTVLLHSMRFSSSCCLWSHCTGPVEETRTKCEAAGLFTTGALLFTHLFIQVLFKIK